MRGITEYLHYSYKQPVRTNIDVTCCCSGYLAFVSCSKICQGTPFAVGFFPFPQDKIMPLQNIRPWLFPLIHISTSFSCIRISPNAFPMPRSGCYNCMKRRIVCDKAKPHCGKCHKRGLVCSGYGVRYRFTAPAVSPFNSANSRKNNARPLKWVDGLKHLRKIPRQAVPGSSIADPGNVSGELSASHRPSDPSTRLLLNLPPILADEDRKVRFLFDHCK